MYEAFANYNFFLFMNSGGLNYTYAVRGAFQGQLHKYQHVKIDISNSNIALHSIVIFALSLELLAKNDNSLKKFVFFIRCWQFFTVFPLFCIAPIALHSVSRFKERIAHVALYKRATVSDCSGRSLKMRESLFRSKNRRVNSQPRKLYRTI